MGGSINKGQNTSYHSEEEEEEVTWQDGLIKMQQY